MVTGELVSTGIVEIDRDGCVHRAQYSTDGRTVAVEYDGLRKEVRLRGLAMPAHATARMLLREILIEKHPAVA